MVGEIYRMAPMQIFEGYKKGCTIMKIIFLPCYGLKLCHKIGEAEPLHDNFDPQILNIRLTNNYYVHTLYFQCCFSTQKETF